MTRNTNAKEAQMPRRFETPFQLSIETEFGKTERSGSHLGTDLALAKDLASERFHGRINAGMPCVTVAVMDSKGRLVDCYDGQWSSERR